MANARNGKYAFFDGVSWKCGSGHSENVFEITMWWKLCHFNWFLSYNLLNESFHLTSNRHACDASYVCYLESIGKSVTNSRISGIALYHSQLNDIHLFSCKWPSENGFNLIFARSKRKEREREIKDRNNEWNMTSVVLRAQFITTSIVLAIYTVVTFFCFWCCCCLMSFSLIR